jgi:PTH1 family peptidyl-tRNA hydrolase
VVKLIAGLGNPGRRYAGSRHNVGYLVVDELARRWRIDAARHDRRCQGLLAEGSAAGQRVLLLKPTTFMNLSGLSVAAVWRFYKLAFADVLIVHDDLDLPVGQIRLRAVGSAGGHKGLLDILRHLGSPEVPRLRVGIGKVHPAATVEYVLSRFEPQEREIIEQALGRAADAVECWLRDGIDAAMNAFNRKGEQQPPARGNGPAAPDGAQGDRS